MTVARRIKQRRIALGLSQDELGSRVGVRQTAVSAWENGRNLPKGEKLVALANALLVNKEWLQFGEGRAAQTQVRLKGYVGAGAKVTVLPDDLGDWVPAPPDEDIETEAFEVRGDSMYPVYRHGDLVYYEKHRTALPEENLGEECVVEVDSGELYIKRIMPSAKPGLFTLASYNSPDIPDQRIISCALVLWVRRKRKNH